MRHQVAQTPGDWKPPETGWMKVSADCVFQAERRQDCHGCDHQR
uniref:Uncharacterized protein n=1 Tax=Arundo donax TaxID=35708 RepID=A0A0A9GPR2_ARUDO